MANDTIQRMLLMGQSLQDGGQKPIVFDEATGLTTRASAVPLGAILGQVAPGATTETVLYTVPTGKTAVLDKLFVCNRSAVGITWRLYFGKGGAAAANEQYTHYDVALAANVSVEINGPMGLQAGDVIRVYASTANTSFVAFGRET